MLGPWYLATILMGASSACALLSGREHLGGAAAAGDKLLGLGQERLQGAGGPRGDVGQNLLGGDAVVDVAGDRSGERLNRAVGAARIAFVAARHQVLLAVAAALAVGLHVVERE